ncbi:hypothetical protein Tco_1565733 [Tanacetum coccineum]
MSPGIVAGNNCCDKVRDNNSQEGEDRAESIAEPTTSRIHSQVIIRYKKFSDGGVIVVEEDPDVIHFDNSSDLPLYTSLNDLNNATLHIDGQSTEVDAPPDIIDLDEDDDIIDDEDALPHDLTDSDDEDALPHDLTDSDDEDLVNVDDDDGVNDVYSSEEED